MAQLVQVIKKFDDGTETIHNFVPNSNAAEIEAAVKASQDELAQRGASFEVSASEPVAGVVVGETSGSEVVFVKCKKRGCKVQMSEGSPEFCPEHQ